MRAKLWPWWLIRPGRDAWPVLVHGPAALGRASTRLGGPPPLSCWTSRRREWWRRPRRHRPRTGLGSRAGLLPSFAPLPIPASLRYWWIRAAGGSTGRWPHRRRASHWSRAHMLSRARKRQFSEAIRLSGRRRRRGVVVTVAWILAGLGGKSRLSAAPLGRVGSFWSWVSSVAQPFWSARHASWMGTVARVCT